MTREDLQSLGQEEYFGSAELAAAAMRLIGELVPAQEKGSVAEIPDERTVRYYLSEGLISPASERRGTAAVYGYLHLLQLLVVKRLQADYLPIRKIKELIENKTEGELEEILISGGQVKQNPALDYLKQLREPPPARMFEASARMLSAPLLTAAEESPWMIRPARRQSVHWTRVELEPGLELHIRDDYESPAESKERRRLTRKLLHEISSRRRKNESDTED